MRWRLVRAPVFGLAVISLAATASAQTRLFVTEYRANDPRILGMNLDGSNSQVLFQPPASEWLPIGCDFDAATGKIYWTNGLFGSGTIRRANLDGSQMELLVSGIKNGRGLSLDLTGGTMYWSTSPPSGNAMGLIQRAGLDGSGLQDFYALAPYDPVVSFVGYPTVDAVNGYVYFCAANEIRRARLDGTGPVETVVRGLNTVTAVALDVANRRIYFLDSNTNTDLLGRAGLDDSEFSVLLDMTPALNQSSGLIDLEIDLAGGKAYWTNDILDTVERANLDGTGREILASGLGLYSPASLAFDAKPPQPMLDCNGNGVRDLDDIEASTSADCNSNGIPDECETDPCATRTFVVDHGSDPGTSLERSLDGNPVNGFQIFQSFDLTESTDLARIGLDGWTIDHDPAGFRAVLMPDDGSGNFPDETAPIDSADFQFRFSPNTTVWQYRDIARTLPAGRYWVRLAARSPVYRAAVNVGVTGRASFSRRADGTIFNSSRSIALRVEPVQEPVAVSGTPGPHAGLAAPAPNPMRSRGWFEYRLESEAEASLELLDVAGRLVRRLESGRMGPGSHRVRWDGMDLAGRPAAPGVYFVRFVSRDRAATPALSVRRFVFLR